MAAVLDDIISCIDSPDRLNDEEYELILNIFSNLLSTDITLTTELTNSIASILSDAKGEHIQRYVPTSIYYKVGCFFPMVIVSILSHVELGRDEHRKDAPHFM